MVLRRRPLSLAASCRQVSPSGDVAATADAAACSVVRDWAGRLLGRAFASVAALAHHLVTSNYVSGRSLAAYSVLAAQPAGVSGGGGGGGGGGGDTATGTVEHLTNYSVHGFSQVLVVALQRC